MNESAAGMVPAMVIVGGGMAAARACINLRANNYDGPITLIGAENLMPYDRPPLSKSFITEEQEQQPVWLLDESIAASLKVDMRLGISATAINRSAKTVTLSDGSTLPYAKLLLATGANPRKLTLPGGEHALLLRTHADAITLRSKFQPGKNVVIIGGGFIGLELASSAVSRGCKVTVIEAQPRILMRGVPEAIAKIVHDKHVSAGVTMLVGTGITSLSTTAVTLADGRTVAADTIIAGIGASPETTLASDAGVTIDNGIACDTHMQTSDPNIFASGDCASFISEKFTSRRIRLEAWRNAQEQAATAAENMAGGSKVHNSVPWFWSDQYDLSLQIAGIPDMGTTTVARIPALDALILFHLTDAGTLIGASGIGPGNSIGRDIKLAEMMIAKGLSPSPAILSDAAQPLKALLKG
jgi:3-phenylpropionate/trans-cinnamate dioxygenase ferredoxin reductase subunit